MYHDLSISPLLMGLDFIFHFLIIKTTLQWLNLQRQLWACLQIAYFWRNSYREIAKSEYMNVLTELIKFPSQEVYQFTLLPVVYEHPHIKLIMLIKQVKCGILL